MSRTVPVERLRIFDRKGFALAEFRASVERSLIIGGEGRARFTYASRKTEIVNDTVLRYGNWLLVESSRLPPWVGMIDTPRVWSPREVEVSAYTPEHQFFYRRGPLEKVLTGSAGSIFEQMIAMVNQAAPTVLEVGNIWKGGTQRQETLNPTPLSENLRRLTERSGEEYAWRPETDANGRLIIYADWVRRIGVDTTALLHEGKGGGNIESLGNVYMEDGDIVNDVLAYGDGMSWKSRPNQIVRDVESIERYGLRQMSEEFRGTKNLTTLKNNGTKYLKQYADSVKTFHINALNVGETFDFLRLGNRLVLRLENMGFTAGLGLETNVRITGMVIDSGNKNKVELSLEEIFVV